MLCCCHPDILNLRTRGPAFLFCTRPWEFRRLCRPRAQPGVATAAQWLTRSDRCRQPHLLLWCHLPGLAPVLTGTSTASFSLSSSPLPSREHSVPSCCSFPASSSFEAIAWQAGAGGTGVGTVVPSFCLPLPFPLQAPSFPWLGSRPGSASPVPLRSSSPVSTWVINERTLAPASSAVCLGTDCFPVITTGSRSGW